MLAMCKAHASRMTFVIGWYYPNDTGLTQKEQFNRLVLEQGIARQTLGRSLTLALKWVRFELFQSFTAFSRGFLTVNSH
jgi:hypothetical protein